MIQSLYVAWRYLRFYWGRSLTLVACVTLIAALPLSLERLLAESERQLLDRAKTTPLVIGAKGSSLDLVMNSLYFVGRVPETITMAAVEPIADSDLALPIPLHQRFSARGFRIVGTNLDYFAFRDLTIADGRGLTLLGDCVLGAEAAVDLGLRPGDALLSAPETLFDLAGVYPLKMRVVGVLAPTGSPDDRAVFVDLKTSWVIEGLVHGHEDLASVTDPTLVMERSDDRVTATAKLAQYTEITAENIDSFHFHGSPERYPITAIIAVPPDARSAALLRGRYLGLGQGGGLQQVQVPGEVIRDLVESIFRIKRVLDAVILVVAIATLLALVLVLALSLRLRQREIETIFKLGGSRSTIVRLLGAEIAIILFAAAVLTGLVLILVAGLDEPLVRALFIH